MGIVYRVLGEPPMPPADADFSFKIDFQKGAGDPRRVFDAASRFIDGLEDLDTAVVGTVDPKIKTLTVLEDVDGGSLKVWLRTVLENIDDEGLKQGEWKKAIGPALVRAKHIAIEHLNKDETDATNSVDQLREELRAIATEAQPPNLIKGGAPIHEGRLLSSLNKIQDAKRLLDKRDHLTIELEGKTYDVDLSKTWSPSEQTTKATEITTEKAGKPTEIILTVRKPDLLGKTQWQFWHGKTPISASIKDEGWLTDFHERKIPLLPGDALRCSVNFTYILDEHGLPIEQKTEIIKIIQKIDGGGPKQTSLFSDH
jgi:hypothetical protein